MCLMYRCLLFSNFGSPVQTYLSRYRIELEIFCCGKKTCFKSISQMYDGVFNSVFSQGVFIKLFASVDIKPARNIQQLSNSLHIAIYACNSLQKYIWHCIPSHTVIYFIAYSEVYLAQICAFFILHIRTLRMCRQLLMRWRCMQLYSECLEKLFYVRRR